MKELLIFIIFSIFFTASKTQRQCFKEKKPISEASGPLKISLTDTIKDFQSGSYNIINSDVQKRERYTCFNITFLYINGKNPYEVVASIQNIDNYQDKQGLDFSIRFSPSQTSIQGLFIMSKTASWTSVTIHYLMSARQDFRLGTFVPETAQFLPCGKQASDLIINHKLIKNWNASKNLIFGLPFLSGIRTMDSQMNIFFNKSTFDPNSSLLQIPIKFAQVNQPIQYLLVGYIIVTMDSEFQVTNIYDLDYVPTDINVFIGMTGVQTAPNTSSIPKVLKTTTILNKYKFRQFFSVQGLVIQSQTSLDLLFSTGSSPNQTTLECISADKCAGYDGYMKYRQNQQGFIFHAECILCQKFASYNSKTQRCECRQLYTRSQNGSCVLKNQIICIQDFQVYNNVTKKCQCIPNYIQMDKKCVLNSTKCPSGFFSFKGSCFRIVWNDNNSSSSNSSNNDAAKGPAVTCPLTEMIYDQTSKSCKCTDNKIFDQVNKLCVSCKQNQAWNKQTKICQCLSGSFRVNNICTYCSQNGFYDGSKCQCLRGFIGDGKNCNKDPTFLNQTLGLMSSADSNGGIMIGAITLN